MSTAGVPAWFHLFLDVPRPGWEEAVEFWSAATGWAVSPPRGEDEQFVTLVPQKGDAWLKMQAIEEVEPRLHIDLDAVDRAAALERSVSLGASSAWTYDGVPVMRSPGGLLFCHTLGEGTTPSCARTEPSRVLDQVCIDIPRSRWEQEVAFWTEITGRAPEQTKSPEFVRLADPDPHGGLRILLQQLDEEAGEVRAHPDLAVADRATETCRHEALGAETVGVLEWWTVMRAPYGQLYCLTDRDPLTGQAS
ncbi:VOC family protein [Nocardioides sp.]|uniref:VOC family protein n=1 Tax=Nocardioides sp. TaxID=35761 RepID=UPI0019887FF2|nr:VOC family protein [Nocardioides sp.]MBC7278035.1 VOC family protein [Nocardioides sp.]